MSVLWEGQDSKPDLSKFYRRETQLTRSQEVARRMLIGLAVFATLAAVAALKWMPK